MCVRMRFPRVGPCAAPACSPGKARPIDDAPRMQSGLGKLKSQSPFAEKGLHLLEPRADVELTRG